MKIFSVNQKVVNFVNKDSHNFSSLFVLLDNFQNNLSSKMTLPIKKVGRLWMLKLHGNYTDLIHFAKSFEGNVHFAIAVSESDESDSFKKFMNLFLATKKQWAEVKMSRYCTSQLARVDFKGFDRFKNEETFLKRLQENQNKGGCYIFKIGEFSTRLERQAQTIAKKKLLSKKVLETETPSKLPKKSKKRKFRPNILSTSPPKIAEEKSPTSPFFRPMDFKDLLALESSPEELQQIFKKVTFRHNASF